MSLNKQQAVHIKISIRNNMDIIASLLSCVQMIHSSTKGTPLVKFVEIISILLKSVFLNASVSLSLDFPAYVRGTQFSYVPKGTSLCLVIKVFLN